MINYVNCIQSRSCSITIKIIVYSDEPAGHFLRYETINVSHTRAAQYTNKYLLVASRDNRTCLLFNAFLWYEACSPLT